MIVLPGQSQSVQPFGSRRQKATAVSAQQRQEQLMLQLLHLKPMPISQGIVPGHLLWVIQDRQNGRHDICLTDQSVAYMSVPRYVMFV
jgi:hypothetical protein